MGSPAVEVDPHVAAVLAARYRGEDLVLPTSGTTSAPRAVLRTTESWWCSFEAYSGLSGVDAGARVWVPGPMSATMNLFAAVHAHVSGAAVVSEPGEATHACLTPTALARASAALRPGTVVVVAGSALGLGQHDLALAAGLRVAHYYGAAELSFVAWGPHAEDLHAFPGVELDVERGEIWVRSPYVASGYRDGDGPLRRREGGWAGVGDRGTLRAGRLQVQGRPGSVDTAGATVELAEVESQLRRFARGPVAVVGVRRAPVGAVLAAVVTSTADRDRLRRVARERLAAACRPRMWRVVDPMPLTTNGKVDRAAVTALFGRPGR